MSDDQLSQAQLLAKRRRERILGNTVNRLDLVTGKAEELKPAPEISARPETSPSSKKLPSSGQNFYRDSAPVRIFKWPSRLFLAFVFSCLLLSVIDVPWLFVKFFVSFAALEFVFYSLNLLHSNAGLRQYMGFLFVRDTFDSGLDEYLKLAVIFLGLQGAGARYFRSMVMHGLQSCADLGIFSTLFLIFVSFQSGYMHISRYQQTMVPLCWTQRRRRIRTTSTSPHCSTSDVFPTYWVALLYGIHQNQTDHFLRHGETSGNVIIYNIFVLCRRMALTVYLSFCAIWITVFTVSTFSYEVMKFKRGNANGTENEGSIIVRLLDNVPWTAIMCRNVIVVVLFCRRYPKMVTLIHDLSSLMRIVDPSPEPLFRFIRLSRRVTLVSFVILIAQLILVQMYYFNANFDGLTRNWSFAPFPLKIVGWQVACCVTIFSLPNFLAAQVIVGTIIGLVAGAHSLVKQVNNSLEKLAVYRRQNIHELCTELCSTVSFDCQVQCPEKLQCEVLSILRLVYFRTVQFAHAVSSVFSETLLVVVAADFASAGGYVGLLIGDPGNPNPIMLYFVRVYHALSTVTSMTFYLILQYWPFIRLPEEAGQTYHQLQSLMIHRGRTSDKWERELMHFLLTTKDSHVGIVAGKVLHFSRHLSVTMITLLCSYGVLVYELMHRKGGGLVVNHPEAPISHSNITFYHNASKV